MFYPDNGSSQSTSPSSAVVNGGTIEVSSDEEIEECVKDYKNDDSFCQLNDENDWDDMEIDSVIAQVILYFYYYLSL